MPADPDNATVTAREDLAPGLAIVRVAYKHDPVPDFIPGQFTTLALPDLTPPDPNKPARRPGRGPKLIRRAYSIASSPITKDHVEFFIVEVEDGKLTPSLFDLHPGDDLFMDPRMKGHFTLDGVPPHQTLVMVATGTGLAPYLSMYRTFKDQPPNQRPWKHLVLLHGSRLAQDLGYREELEAAAAQDPHLTYLATTTREPDGSPWQGLRGRVTQHLQPDTFQQLTGQPLDPKTCHVFLCGNPAMIDQAETELTPLGFSTKTPKNPTGNLHFERYW
ncbi:MAG: ferredoxin--NADP reductase [Planctomycetota bacterium]